MPGKKSLGVRSLLAAFLCLLGLCLASAASLQHADHLVRSGHPGSAVKELATDKKVAKGLTAAAHSSEGAQIKDQALQLAAGDGSRRSRSKASDSSMPLVHLNWVELAQEAVKQLEAGTWNLTAVETEMRQVELAAAADAAPDSRGSGDTTLPAITGIAVPKFFSYASKVVVQLVQENFQKVNLAHYGIDIGVPVLGTIHFDLDDIRLNGLSLERATSGLALGSDNVFVLRVDNLDADATAAFHYRRKSAPHIQGHGQAAVTVSRGTLLATLKAFNDGQGHPQIAFASPPVVDFAGIDVSISGTQLAWLYNLVLGAFKDHFQPLIAREVERQIADIVPREVNKLLQGIPLRANVEGLVLDISMVGDPLITADHFQVTDWGRFQAPNGSPQDCPFTSGGTPPPLLSAATSMLQGSMEQSVLNCYTWGMLAAGWLQAELGPDDVPLVLTTDFWRALVPPVAEKYPGQKMRLQMRVLNPPLSRVTAGNGIFTSGNVSMAFHLDARDSPLLFIIDISGQLAVTHLMVRPDVPDRPNADRLFASVEIVRNSLVLSVPKSNVGAIDVSQLQAITRGFVSVIVQNMINAEFLGAGYPLPEVPHAKFVSSSLGFADGFITATSDVQYVR